VQKSNILFELLDPEDGVKMSSETMIIVNNIQGFILLEDFNPLSPELNHI
jgi:hypothetical protein